MSEIEDEIRRRLIAEREQQLQRSASDVLAETGNGASSAGGAVATVSEAAVPIAAPRPRRQSVLERWKQRGGVLGAIASVLLMLGKVVAPILAVLGKLKYFGFALKFLLTAGTMIVSMWAYSLRWGWSFGVGLVLLIFIHECGHALAARLRGIKTGIMVFVPFMGAFVTTKRYGQNLEEDAFIGIAGPIVGSAASALCAALYLPTHNPFWLSLGQWGMFINLFNLLPTPPLDGGWITPLFSPKLLALGMVLAVIVGFQNPLIWLLLLVSIPRVIAGWKADPKTQPYYQVPASVKWKYGIVYVGLAGLLALGQHSMQTFLVQ
jgi:Zn-dependent protease